jgi:hypothetical protein
LPGKTGQASPAAHGDHDIGGLHFAGGQRLGELGKDVEPDLGHGLDDGGVELVRRL